MITKYGGEWCYIDDEGYLVSCGSVQNLYRHIMRAVVIEYL